MTREEAIEILKAHHMWTGEPQEIIDVRKENKALEMAIQALSQEPTVTLTDEPMTMVYPTIVCDDAVSRDAVNNLQKYRYNCGDTSITCVSLKSINELPSVTQKSGSWIALVARPMTNEEREYYSEQLDYCDGDAAIYNCPLPEEGQEVLITTCTGGVLIDTFFNDCDGCGFEGYDIEDVKAWMPLPKPYDPRESEGVE